MSEEETNKDNEPEVITATLSEQFQQKIADQHAKNLEELSPLSQYTIHVGNEDLVYKRRKILTSERKEIERLRADLAWQARRGSKEMVETEDKLYKKCAEFYLVNIRTGNPMTPEEFDQIAWEDLKKILDACSYRTERPVPPLED